MLIHTNVKVFFSRIRALKTSKVGQLTKISGQVVRTHPVHPELVSGTFVCLECQTSIPGVDQQFKFTQPAVCRNPVCANRTKFMLDINQSKFVDFQKVNLFSYLIYLYGVWYARRSSNSSKAADYRP